MQSFFSAGMRGVLGAGVALRDIAAHATQIIDAGELADRFRVDVAKAEYIEAAVVVVRHRRWSVWLGHWTGLADMNGDGRADVGDADLDVLPREVANR
jgi:hypothetical protein